MTGQRWTLTDGEKAFIAGAALDSNGAWHVNQMPGDEDMSFLQRWHLVVPLSGQWFRLTYRGMNVRRMLTEWSTPDPDMRYHFEELV